MEYRWYSVLESFRVPLGLFHCLGDVQPFHPLSLNMDPREAGKVRDLSIALGSPGLYAVAVFLEDVGKFKLTGAALSLRSFSDCYTLPLVIRNHQGPTLPEIREKRIYCLEQCLLPLRFA